MNRIVATLGIAGTFAASRSYIFAPANNERLVEKVFGAGADAVVLDLEDAVPADQKRAARKLAATALGRRTSPGPRVYVRINAISTDLWREDIATIVCSHLDGIRVAKVESSAELEELHATVSKAESSVGLSPGTIRVVPTIESAAGVLAAAEIAKSSRVEALSFGEADFLRDIGVGADASQLSTLYAQSHLVLVSRAAGISPPIASAFTRIHDLEGLRASSELARQLGFFGRSCIHPKQVPVIHEIFTPTEAQVAEARNLIEAFEQAERKGSGASMTSDGRFVDKAVVESARAVIRMAERGTYLPTAEGK